MRCLRPFTKGDQTFNCGRCHACRVNKTQQWAVRLVYELDNWNYASFVTLTYDDDHLPTDNTLSKFDLESFLDSLRYELKKKNRTFRYYACGEYGSDPRHFLPGQKHGRAHYHLILFGLNPSAYDDDNYDRELISKCWKKCDPILWTYKPSGNNAIDYVNRSTIAYVTGYVQKKLNGDLAKEIYGDRQPPFSVCSQGLGLDFFLKNRTRFEKQGYLTLNGKKVAIPKYFRDKIGMKQMDNISVLKKRKIEDEVDSLCSDFNDWFDRRRGAKDCTLEQRLNWFQYWYDNRLFDISTTVERDFLQHKKLKGGKL